MPFQCGMLNVDFLQTNCFRFAKKMSSRGSKYLTSLLLPCSAQYWTSLQSGCGEVHLEVLKISFLLAAAVTSHCISLFYGHRQLWNSLSPFGNICQHFIYNLRAQPVSYRGRCVLGEYTTIHTYKLTDFKERRNACVVPDYGSVCRAYLCQRAHCGHSSGVYFTFLSQPHHLTEAAFLFFFFYAIRARHWNLEYRYNNSDLREHLTGKPIHFCLTMLCLFFK